MKTYFRKNALLVNFNEYYHAANPQQKTTIFSYVALANLMFIIIIALFAHKLHHIKKLQDDYIQVRIEPHTLSKADKQKLVGKTAIDTQVFAWKFADINMKEKALLGDYKVAFNYHKQDFPNGMEFDVGNGILTQKRLINTIIESGNVTSDLFLIEASIEPKYMLQLYPLDRELISIRLTPPPAIESYYFEVSEFDDYTEGAQNDYELEQMGFVNTLESYSYTPPGSKIESTVYYANNRSFMVFNHKNIFSYLKSIQYIILSIAIAMFSLLINSKTNSPKNGRVGVIGGSVFALAANVFQINSTIKVVNAITLIDLITFFSGITILTCFLTTVRTLRFIDEDGYQVSKLFDLMMFITIFIYVIFFFSFVYWYA